MLWAITLPGVVAWCLTMRVLGTELEFGKHIYFCVIALEELIGVLKCLLTYSLVQGV